MTSKWGHRGLVTLLCAGAVWHGVGVVQDLDLVPRDHEQWFEITWMNLLFAGYALLLAQVMIWKAGDSPAGRSLSLFLAALATCLTLSVIPSGSASPTVTALFSVFWIFMYLVAWRFWATFPEPMESTAVTRLSSAGSGGGWFGPVNRFAARIVGLILTKPVPRAFFILVAVVFGYELSHGPSFEYNILIGGPGPPPTFRGFLLVASSITTLFATIAFAWVAYLLADPDGRRRVMWVVLAQLVIGLWAGVDVLASMLGDVTGLQLAAQIGQFFRRTFMPVSLTLDLTALAVAIFYSGAFDLRPIIGRTTAYGGALLVLTVLFAGIEELLQSQLADRLGISGGAAGWIGAVLVGLTVGPVHGRVQRFVRRLGTEIERSGLP